MEFWAQDGSYAHCELLLDGQHFMSLSEAPAICNHNELRIWNNMAFNFMLDGREAVLHAYNVMRQEGSVIDELGHPYDWTATAPT